ncbi:DUF4347 domain-containing protein, partial [Candidatus Venteria ishoeyi]|uniref:DUF4347 domain-containing protein n=1 Tax=Candidatus Venteria ishoeyi TaxID=1899563 RepID=UPI0015AB0CF6
MKSQKSKSPKNIQSKKTTALFEKLEDRVLLSADPIAAIDLPDDPGLDSGGLNEVGLFSEGIQFQENPVLAPVQNETEQDAILIESDIDTDAIELVFVDERVAETKGFLEGLRAQTDAEIFVVKADQDGIEQITETLQQHDNVAAVHILSHASESKMILGLGTLEADNLSDYSEQISGWQGSLTEQADILLYGCDVAGNQVGVEFVENLAELTGADVAASDDDTGAEALDGDWDLEYQTGAIETVTLVNADWQGVLAANDISGKVIKDHEGDGSITGDVGIEKVHIYVFKNDGADSNAPDATDSLVTSTITNTNGEYSFSGLVNGTYWIVAESDDINGIGAAVEQTYGGIGALVDEDSDHSTEGTPRLNAGSAYGGRYMVHYDEFSEDNQNLVDAEHIIKVIVNNDEHNNLDFGFSFLEGLAGGYSEYYIPGKVEQLWAIMESIDDGPALAEDSGLVSIISVTATADKTVVYYNHWEDGLDDFDPNNPYSADEIAVYDSTSPAAPAGYTGNYNLFSDGQTHTFKDTITPVQPRDTSFKYDGGDQLYIVGGPTTVAQAFWPAQSSLGTVYGNSWELYPVKPFQTEYVIPIGTDLDSAPYNYDDFSYVYALVQATKDDTRIEVLDKTRSTLLPLVGTNAVGIPEELATSGDNDGDGFAEVVLQRGESAIVGLLNDDDTNGSKYDDIGTALEAGTIISANADHEIQVQLIVGDRHSSSAASESRGYTIVPKNLWDNEYFSPVPGFAKKSSNQGGNTDLYIYNPYDTALEIFYEDKGQSGATVSIPATSTLAYSDLPDWADNAALDGSTAERTVPEDSGVYLKSTDGREFWAIGAGDTEAKDFDWGFDLVPAYIMRDTYYVGWTPGNSNADPDANPKDKDDYSPPKSGSPVYVTAANDNTRIFVDFDGDGVRDAYDFNKDGTTEADEKEGVLDRLDVIKISDSYYEYYNTAFPPVSKPVGMAGDNDTTKARIWATGPITMAWGEDADVADWLSPYMDMGYTNLPLPVEWMDVALGIVKSVDLPTHAPIKDQIARFTLAVPAYQAVDDVVIKDILPKGWKYYEDGATKTEIKLDHKGTVQNSNQAPVPVLNGATERYELSWNLVSIFGDALADLKPNDYVVIKFSAQTVNDGAGGDPDVEAGYNQNNAIATGTITKDPDGAGGNDPFDETVTAEDDAYVYLTSLIVDKDTTTPNVVPNGEAKYEIKVKNIEPAGGEDVVDVTLKDVLPDGFSFVSDSATYDPAVYDPAITGVGHSSGAYPQPTQVGNDLTWPGTWTFKPEATLIIKFDANVGATPGTYDNTVEIVGSAHGGNFSVKDVGETENDAGTDDSDTPALDDPENDEDVTVGFSIGDKVWNDNGAGGGVAADGIQNGTEPGVQSVTVKLLNSAATDTLQTTVTDSNGNYAFNGLAAGDYIVEFSNLPGGYTFTHQNKGGDEAGDSDADRTTGRVTLVGLAASTIEVDAGIILAAQVGDLVWEDNGAGGGTAGDGIQNGSEAGVDGITVTLLNSDSSATGKTDTTADGGQYGFTDLVPGGLRLFNLATLLTATASAR